MHSKKCPCCLRPLDLGTKVPKLCSPRCVAIHADWQVSQSTLTLNEFFDRYYSAPS